MRQRILEHLIEVAIQTQPRTQPLRHTLREHPVVLHPVGTEPMQRTPRIHKAKTIPVGKARHPRHREIIVLHLLHRPHKLTQRFRRIHRKDIRHTPLQEVMRKATIETLLRFRIEQNPHLPVRRPHILPATLKNLIQAQTIPRHHILHIRNILQAPLYFQRRSPRIQQLLQMFPLVHILQRQQILIPFNHSTLRILQVKLQATELRTLPPVRTPAKAMLRRIALTAIAHTQSTMDKHLQRHLHHPVNLTNLLQRQLPGQHHLRKALPRQETHLLRRTIIHLRTRMQLYRRQMQPFKRHILHNQSIHPRTIQLPRLRLRLRQLFIRKNCIHSHIHLRPEDVRKARQLRDILERIARRSPRPETRRADINGIGTVAYSLDAAFQILGRSQEFYSP